MRLASERSHPSAPAPWLWSALVLGGAVAAVWSTGAASTGALAEGLDLAIPEAKENTGRWLGRWTLKTADTTLTLGVRSDQKLYLCRLASRAGWNWVKVPSPFPL